MSGGTHAKWRDPLRLTALVLWVLALLCVFMPAQANALKAAKVGEFERPVQVVGPAGAKKQIFVVEQEGVVRVIGPKGKVGTFLDIRDLVGSGSERGLLSIAFPRDYRESGLFYAFLTDDTGDLLIQEYRRAGKQQRKARRSSARTLLRVRHRDYENHNGGQLQFGPDGNLWIGIGDGGGGGDPFENGQSPGSLLGKLLRIDPRRSGERPYTVPADNPYVGREGHDEIYAIGLRNPYRFSFDRAGGDLLLADVGQERWEEVNRLPWRAANGANFGWDAFEGLDPYEEDEAPSVAPFHTPPLFQYPHENGNCSITGGYVVRDPKIRSLAGRYVYADYCRGQVRSVLIEGNGSRGDAPVRGLPVSLGIASFGEDTAARIYVANVETGLVYRIKKGTRKKPAKPRPKDPGK